MLFELPFNKNKDQCLEAIMSVLMSSFKVILLDFGHNIPQYNLRKRLLEHDQKRQIDSLCTFGKTQVPT